MHDLGVFDNFVYEFGTVEIMKLGLFVQHAVFSLRF